MQLNPTTAMTGLPTKRIARGALLLLTMALHSPANGGVLPEDRADLMYHTYDGGGITVQGPSLLVRKKFGESVSVAANYYIDMVSGASIDTVVSGASEFKEERHQVSAAVDYLRGKTTYNVSFINSDESDYTANTASVGISEDMFGDLTTISLGYTRAWDRVQRNARINGVIQNDPTYGDRSIDKRSYRVGLSQVITKNLIMGLNYESQTHEGELGNPYRNIRFLSLGGVETFGQQTLPGTRTTNAATLDARYFLWYRAALRGSYRFFTDTWGVRAQTAEIEYAHPWRAFTFEASYRYHSQDAADFYRDLFPRPDFQNFMARDRNLSTMKDQTVHLGVTYDLARIPDWTNSFLEKGSVSLFVDHIMFDHEDFRDARVSRSDLTLVGNEPAYSDDANMIRLFVSVWF